LLLKPELDAVMKNVKVMRGLKLPWEAVEIDLLAEADRTEAEQQHLNDRDPSLHNGILLSVFPVVKRVFSG
jgi:hypothetical protein